jgi:phosphoribosyl 1,2-cyclic phosphodiesterase
MRIGFWGVRGSIPCPGPGTAKYGGNTPCIELRFGDTDRLIVIDAGSGIRELGNFILTHDLPRGPLRIELFLSHTHWDHIMGFPFFGPIYVPDTHLEVYGPISYETDTLEKIVGGQLTYRYFPVRQAELQAKIDYIPLKEGRSDLGDGMILMAKYLNHPLLCLGYRFEHEGKVFCTAYDTEPFRNLFSTDPESPDYDEAMAREGEIVAKEQNEALERFFAGADLLVHDCQYTQDEYESAKVGWGHSSFDYACAAASRAGVKALVLFHHEPTRTDNEMDGLAETYCRPGKYGNTRIVIAREGMQIEL